MDFSKLTDEEIIEYEILLKQIDIDDLWKELRNPTEKSNPNYRAVFNAYHQQKYEGDFLVSGAKGVVQEGSARSGKTYSDLSFIVATAHDSKKPLAINIIRDVYGTHKTTTYKDMAKIYDSLGIEDNPFTRLQDIGMVRLGVSQIFFLGANNDASVLGNGADIVYMNEGDEISYDVYSNSVMRCGFFIIDYNPKYTQHWIYDKVLKRDDVWHLRTTFKDNPHIPLGQKADIMASEPFESGSYDIVGDKEIWYNGKPISETNQPPPHERNVAQGTADLFKWTVFGLGLRGAMEGVIFRNVVFIEKEELPIDLQGAHSYGLDFGFANDPTVLTRNWENDTDIYIEVLSYYSIDTPNGIVEMFEENEVEDWIPITCDSSDKHTTEGGGAIQMVMALQDYGYEAYKVSKTKGVMFWISSMNCKRINFIKTKWEKQARNEAENYRFKEIHGIATNQPIDKHNHIWDSARYRHMAFNDNISVQSEWS